MEKKTTDTFQKYKRGTYSSSKKNKLGLKFFFTPDYISKNPGDLKARGGKNFITSVITNKAKAA